jgi:hypothetical protein
MVLNYIIKKKHNKDESNIKLPYDSDRSGIHTAIIEIDFVITIKDPVSQTYTLIAKDYTIDDERYINLSNILTQEVEFNRY